MNVALVTCSALAGMTDDDRLILDPLKDAGVDAEIVVWEDPYIDWAEFDAAVVRSAWDYAYRVGEFRDWIRRVAGSTRLMNASGVLLPNTHKGYLLELYAAEVPVVPTLLLEKGEALEVEPLVTRMGWDSAIVKPAVGASARHVYRVNGAPDAQVRGRLERVLAHEDLIVQPFLADVLTEGEVSMVYVDGVFTHAVLKRPGEDSLYVQEEKGGSTTLHEPTSAEHAAADAALATLAETPLYARVDLIPASGGPLVSELELIEPDLFFRFSAEAAERFAVGVATAVRETT